MRRIISTSWISYTVFALIFITSVQGQNIVPNNGFETYTALPTGYGQWYDASGWNDVNMYPAFLWPYASPDYLHMTGAGGADLPVCTFGTVTPYAGNAVMGFVTWLASTPDFREYLSVAFSSSMVVGTTYTISFWITNGSAGWYCGNSSNHVGVRLSLSPLTQITHEPIGGIPQCEFAGELWSTTWQYVSFTFVADQAYNYITIGNFYNDLATAHTAHVGSPSPGAYYFIDEVVVQPAAILPLTLTAFNAEENNDQVQLTWTTQNELNTQRFIIERSADGEQFDAIGELPAAGFSEQELNYSFVDITPLSGDNYYRLKMEDNNGDFNYSEIEYVRMEFISSVKIISGPNPCEQVFNINTNDGSDHDYYLYAMNGKIVASGKMQGGSAQIDMSNLAKGIYLLRINDADLVYTEKVVVR